MSEVIGLVSVLPPDGEMVYPGADGSSEETRQIVDREVRRIVEECYVRAVEQLREHRDRLDSLARALLQSETLDEAEAYAAAGFERGTAPGDRPPAGLLKEPSSAAPESL
jgi:cell division protease FtsH